MTTTSRIYEKLVDGDMEAHLVALTCGEPHGGYARWSLHLLADKPVELNVAESISRETEAEKITLVMDNPGTYIPRAFYERFNPPEAKRIWDRFEFVYTPKHRSWLNNGLNRT
jgi:hypothetical protein